MKSFSQAGQDLWVYEITEHKVDGFYVDLGCSDATKHSNTYALEQLGWKGLLVDIMEGCESRKGTFIRSDATSPNERLRLYYKHLPPVIDYLSIDCDDATLGAINAFPWPTCAFRVATIETDVYLRGPEIRDNIRNIMQSLGYQLVCGDVKVEWPNAGDRSPYEDWFCDPELVNPEMVKRFTCDGKFWKDIVG